MCLIDPFIGLASAMPIFIQPGNLCEGFTQARCVLFLLTLSFQRICDLEKRDQKALILKCIMTICSRVYIPQETNCDNIIPALLTPDWFLCRLYLFLAAIN